MKNDSELRHIIQAHTHHSVTPVIVTKGHPVSTLEQAHRLGHRHFGENHVQPALEKIHALKKHNITWHFIGRIQSNKTTPIAQHFDWAQTVASEKIAHRLCQARTQTPLNVCIQVTLTPTEHGITLAALPKLIAYIQTRPNLKLRGLFYKPPPMLSATERHDAFATITQCFDQYPELDTLSMGMTSDFREALTSGSTMIRLGTYVLGPRIINHKQN